VKKGGLILRNMTDASVNNVRILYKQDNGYEHLWHGIAGKVEDGYILYDGDGSQNPVLPSQE
jgi:hypothetical protein